MQLQQLEYAVALARYLNFTRTADVLHITQPTLSQQIKRLESDLGVELFIRQTRSVTLTPAGKTFLTHAHKVLLDVERLENSMSRFKNQLSGNLPIAVPVSFSVLGIADCMEQFQQLHPSVSIDITISHGNDLLKLLSSSVILLGFLAAANTDWITDAFYTSLLRSDRMHVLLNTASPLSQKSSLDLEELADFHMILPDPHSFLNGMLMNEFRLRGISPKISYQASAQGIIPDMLSTNVIGFMAPPFPPAIQNRRDICAVPLNADLFRNIYFVCLKSRLDTPLIRAFREHMSAFPALTPVRP